MSPLGICPASYITSARQRVCVCGEIGGNFVVGHFAFTPCPNSQSLLNFPGSGLVPCTGYVPATLRVTFPCDDDLGYKMGHVDMVQRILRRPCHSTNDVDTYEAAKVVLLGTCLVNRVLTPAPRPRFQGRLDTIQSYVTFSTVLGGNLSHAIKACIGLLT